MRLGEKVWDRFILFCRFAGRIFLGALAFNQNNAPDARFIEEHDGRGEDNLGDDIGRREKSRKGEDYE